MAVKSVKADGEPAGVFDERAGMVKSSTSKPSRFRPRKSRSARSTNEAAKKQAEIDRFDAKQQAEFHCHAAERAGEVPG